MRWRSIVGASALLLAVSGYAVSPTFAQTPAAPTTVAGSPDDKSKDDPNAAEKPPKPDKPKAETPSVAAPAQPPVGAAKPQPEESNATEPKPTADSAKPDKPKPAAPKPNSDKAKTTDKQPEPAKAETTDKQPEPAKPTPAGPKPKPEKPKPIADDPSPPPHAHGGPASVQAPGAEETVQAAPTQTASPSTPAGHSVASARAEHVSTSPAPRSQHTTALHNRRGASGAPTSRPTPLGAGTQPHDATAATYHRADRATTHAARVGPDDAAPAAAPGERRPTSTLPLDPGPPGYDVTLLLTIISVAGIAFLIGRETRRHPRLGARR